MSLVLNVEILGEFKKLTSASKGAQSELQGLNKRISGFASSAGKAFASIGVGLSFAVLAQQLTEATKAAVEDRKSQELLAVQLRNTMKATDAQIASVEESIKQMSLSSAVADDQLRPAYAKLAIATGDVEESNRLMAIALDASAATGKSLDVVAQAMARSLAGNDTALTKLIPSLKGSKNPIDDMATAFAGASAAAANLDPYQKMQVQFGEIQETIGAALLPLLDQFVAWLNTDHGKKFIDDLVTVTVDLLTAFRDVATWAIANKDWLLPLVKGIAAVTVAWKAVTTAVTATRSAIALATAAQLAFNAAASVTPGAPAAPKGTTSLLTKIAPLAIAGGSAAGAAAGGYLTSTERLKNTQTMFGSKPGDPFAGAKEAFGYTNNDNSTTNVTVNVNTSTMTGSDLLKSLRQFGNSTGVSYGY
jgi:hypothetical protein